jgi:Protein of unknown function (DUF3375)
VTEIAVDTTPSRAGDVVAVALPTLDPALRKVMAGFFDLVGHQIDEVERIQQRCAQRVKRFTAFGTMENSRGVARQLNDAIGTARALLKSSFTDSRLDIDVPLARHAISSVGALGFRIGDCVRRCARRQNGCRPECEGAR